MVLTFLTLLHCHKHLLAKETSGQNTPLYIPKQGSCSIFLSSYVHQLLENLNKITDALKCVLRGRYIHSGIGQLSS